MTLELRPEPREDVAQRVWSLRSTLGEWRGTVELRRDRPPLVRPASGGTYRVEAYGRGWKLVARATRDEEPLLWYTGRWVRSGGRLLVAPDREYDVRSTLWRRLDLRISDPAGFLVADVRGRPRGDDEAEVDVRLHAPPTHREDAALLETFAATLGLLVIEQGRLTRAYGGGSG